MNVALAIARKWADDGHEAVVRLMEWSGQTSVDPNSKSSSVHDAEKTQSKSFWSRLVSIGMKRRIPREKRSKQRK